MNRVLSGLDRVRAGHVDAVEVLKGRRVGLLAHAASVDALFVPALEVLEGAGAVVVELFGPEHGFAGAAQDMVGVSDETSAAARAAPARPVRSLYGDSIEDLWPREAWLRDLDAVVIDLQDVGARYYTYVWTAALMMRTAAKLGVQTVVLDRPNPLGGTVVEGAPQRPGYTSFVGWYAVPVRHGMTIAEILRFVAAEEQLPDDALQVVTMQGWRRSMEWTDTGLPWVMPSPNMPTRETAVVYPGGCLVEGTTLSEGRGTTRPFELWGGPGIDSDALVRSALLEGAILRRVAFEPTFQKHAGVSCAGIQVHVTDPKLFQPYRAYQRLLYAALRQMPAKDRWRTETYEFVDDRPAIDLLTGGPEFRNCVDDGVPLDALHDQDELGSRRFVQSVVEHFLYPR